RVGDRSRKYVDRARKRIDALLAQRVVIWHRARSDVARNREECLRFTKVGDGAVLGNHRDGVGLAQIETFRPRTVKSSDRRNAGEVADETGEHAWGANGGGETKLKRDVGHAVAVIVDLHFIENAGVEREVVRSVGRLQKRVDVHDHDDVIGLAGI